LSIKNIPVGMKLFLKISSYLQQLLFVAIFFITPKTTKQAKAKKISRLSPTEGKTSKAAAKSKSIANPHKTGFIKHLALLSILPPFL
jgi:hypothetical protein